MNYKSIDFSKQQKNVISHIDGPAMVLAVPGAGKTTVTIFRTNNLILNHQVPANRILSLTFSKFAANDMKYKYLRFFGDKTAVPSFSTIHSFSYKILREYAYLSGKTFNLIDGGNNDSDKYKILRQIYSNINQVFLTEDKMEELINQISYCNNFRLAPQDTDIKNKIKNFDEIYFAYTKYKKEHSLIDFDDMLIHSLYILENNAQFRYKYQNLYDFIQIDEAQDTSVIQQDMIDILSDKHKNILMVADDDQSIYGFRGASPTGLFEFKNKYPEHTLYFMEDNYRSSKDIVLASNYFIKQNFKRYKKEIRHNKIYPEPVFIHKFNDEYEQLSFLFESLKCADGLSKSVLARTNLSLIPIANALSEANIDFNIKDIKHSFFNHWIVNDIISIILFSLNPMDYKALEVFYYKLNLYISKKSINILLSKENFENAFDVLANDSSLKLFQIEQFKVAKGRFKFLSKLKPFDAIDYILSELNYEKYLDSYAEMVNTNMDSYKKVLSTIKMLSKGHEDLANFVIHMKNLKKNLSTPNKNATITLSTVHSAKGLEFDEVFLIDLLEDEFPVNASAVNQSKLDELEEERRLFYVAMTRAKQKLHLITYFTRCDQSVKSSSFLNFVENCGNIDFNKTEIDDFIVEGQCVVHSIFNKGRIISVKDDCLSIYFEATGKKELSKKLCLEKRLLKPM